MNKLLNFLFTRKVEIKADVTHIDLTDNTIVIIQVPQAVGDEALNQFRDYIGKTFPMLANKCMVLAVDGLKITTIEKKGE